VPNFLLRAGLSLFVFELLTRIRHVPWFAVNFQLLLIVRPLGPRLISSAPERAVTVMTVPTLARTPSLQLSSSTKLG
jgi:hypothetical protein